MRPLDRLLALLLLATPGCKDSPASPAADMSAPPDEPFVANCTVAMPGAEAVRHAGRAMDGVILPGGRKLTPAGAVIDVGGFPLAMRVLPGDRYVVVTDGAYGDEALRIVDTRPADPAKAVVSKVAYPDSPDAPQAPALFYGLALTKDGKRLYVSNGGHDALPDARPPKEHYNTIDVFDIAGSPPQLVRNAPLTIKLSWDTGGGAAQNRYPSGMQLSSDEKLLYVANQFDSSLSIVSLAQADFGAEIGRAVVPGIGPYDVAVDEATHTAFVSLWGGQTKGKGVFVDGVALVDVTDPRRPAALPDVLPTGKAAEAEVMLGGKLYVTNADSDTLSVVDVASRKVQTHPVATGALLGASPNNLAIDEAAGLVYVASAGENAVAVLDLKTFAPKGRIPTAWYPTSVAVRGDGSVLILSAKGLGLGPATKSPSPDYMSGVLQVVPRPSPSDLAAGDMAALANLDRPRANQPALTCPGSGPKRFPLPPDEKSQTPIKHVFLIVRENKTYDAVLGDLETGDGDKGLVLFGEENTPNTHALARAFVTLDNFYSLAEASIQGHEWTTASFANDYTEKGWLTTWGRGSRPVGAFGSGTYERLGYPGSGSIFTHLDGAGLAYRNYGEVVNTAGAKITLDPAYPGVIFNLGMRDVMKIQYVIEHLGDPDFTVPFSYIVLPNDHTYGTTPGKPTPQSMVADNDEATGRFIDALSRSPLWKSSIVFVIEDDPQDGGDHIEPHRSPCLVISPWIKRGYRSGVNYDVPAMYRTIELLLGVGPMNQYDAHAAAMYDLFRPTPDETPYTFIPRKIPETINATNAPLGEESARIDWSKPDQAALGRILWKAVKGKSAEPPWREGRAHLPIVRDLDD